MKQANLLLLSLFISFLTSRVSGQTSKDIQGTWRVVTTTITNEKGEVMFRMDSSTHNLTKIITPSRITFTIYNTKNDSLEVTGQGKATTKGNQYIETFEQATDRMLLREPLVFTYKVQGDKLSYEGGLKDFHIVEVLKRIE